VSDGHARLGIFTDKGVVMGGFIFGVGFIGGGIVWLYTTYVFFATDQTALALISLIVPPAGLVLPFLISVPLGIAGLTSIAIMFTGGALMRD
jgi:apolipoprotein N-acyltransferase